MNPTISPLSIVKLILSTALIRFFCVINRFFNAPEIPLFFCMMLNSFVRFCAVIKWIYSPLNNYDPELSYLLNPL